MEDGEDGNPSNPVTIAAPAMERENLVARLEGDKQSLEKVLDERAKKQVHEHLVVTDGVGGWADLGVNAGYYARELMSNSVNAIQDEPQGSVDPARVLEKAYSSMKAKGSSAACIIALIDQYMDENKSLILKIVESQNSGKLSECAELSIQRLEISKNDLRQMIAKEARGNAILQSSLKRRKQAFMNVAFWIKYVVSCIYDCNIVF